MIILFISTQGRNMDICIFSPIYYERISIFATEKSTSTPTST